MLFVSACFVVFWSGKIYTVNKTQKHREIVCEPQCEMVFEGIKVSEKESHIYEQKSFEHKYGVNIGYIEGGRVLCTCLEVTNVSDEYMTWDDVFELLECGFESDTWAGAIAPVIGQQLNILYSAGLGKNDSCALWFVTTMHPVSFKRSTWDYIQDEDFYYVLSMTPEKRKIHLDIREVE